MRLIEMAQSIGEWCYKYPGYVDEPVRHDGKAIYQIAVLVDDKELDEGIIDIPIEPLKNMDEKRFSFYVNFSRDPEVFIKEDWTRVTAAEVEEMYSHTMTAQECIEKVDELWKEIIELDPRDFYDDLEEPLGIEILGFMCEYREAIAISADEASIGEEEILLKVMREVDIEVGKEKLLEYPMTLDYYREYMNGLIGFLRENEEN